MAVGTLGIDLGMTNARVAWVEGEQPVLLETLDGQRALPAVVAISKDGQLHVGDSARNQSLLAPDSAATRLRRLLGTTQRVYLDDQGFSAHELVAVVLSQLKEMAEQRLGYTVPAATVAVPTYFTATQRQAVYNAATLAGFRAVKLVLEPVAAALAYGLRATAPPPPPPSPEALPELRAVKEQRLLVFDLGARSCDVTILERAPDGDSFTWAVRAAAGGGQGSEDCDDRIAQHLLTLYERDYSVSPRGSRKALARLKLAAEWAKRTLSRLESTEVRIPGLMTVGRTPLDLLVELSREQLDLLVEDEVRKSVDLIEIALRDARLLPSELSAVLLSSGGTHMPLVGRLLSQALLMRPLSGPAPEEVIALGAALFASGVR